MSCDKKPINEDIPVVNPEGGDETDPADGPRVITVSFNTKATRTVLGEDTLIPSFEEGNVIVVTDGNDEQHCPVYFKDGYARIDITKESLKNKEVTAVYPESAYIPDEPYFVVPSVQDGTFANANICKTKIAAGATAAVFKNQTAIFEIDIPEAWAARCVTVTSLRSIFDELDEEYPTLLPTGQRYTKEDENKYNEIETEFDWAFYSLICNGLWNDDTDEYDVITDESSMDIYEKGRYITIGTTHVQNPPVIKGKCYVSVLTDDDDKVRLRDLNFDVQNNIYGFTYQEEEDGELVTKTSYDSGAGYMGGFSPLFLNQKFGEGYVDKVTAQKGAIYTGVADHLHEYVNGGNVKWATLNIGANSTSDSGLYFAWGGINGHMWNGTYFEPTKNDSGYAFTWASSPFGETETQNNMCYELMAGNGKISFTLPLKYDAAYQNWGGAWRMPRTNDELGFSVDFKRTSNYGVKSTDRGELSFLPAKHSNTSGTGLQSETTATFWTSSLDNSNPTRAYCLTYQRNGVNFSTSSSDMTTTGGLRCCGHVIRPVAGQEVQ